MHWLWLYSARDRFWEEWEVRARSLPTIEALVMAAEAATAHGEVLTR